MKYVVVIVLFVVLVIGLFLFVEQEQEIKIGVIGTFTGVGAYNGQQELRGLELAKEEINSNGGINGKLIELVAEDSKADPATSITALNKLIEFDQIKFIVGDSWTSTTEAMLPIVNQRDVILISPAATLDTLSRNDMFFRTIPTTKNMMIPLAEYAYTKMNSSKVGILHSETSFGIEHAQDFREAFEDLDGQIVGEESFPVASRDVRSEITKIMINNPDTIFNLHASGPRLGLLMEQAQELGLDVQWLGSYGSESSTLMEEYGDFIEGLTYPYPYDYNSKEEGSVKFTNSYLDKYNELPDLYAANSYDALNLLATAIENVGEDPLAVKEFLLSVENYPGGSGEISFDQNGDVEKSILIKTVKNREFVVVDQQ